MVLRKKELVILAILLLFSVLQAKAVSLLPLNGDWRYIQSPHFRVYFQPGQESFAERTADKAEAVHVELVKFLRWLPYGYTNIIIADHSDIVNGFSNILPRRTIIIYPAQNTGERNNFDDWLNEVLIHEYTHILQMDMQSGFPAGFNSIFGRLYFIPNALQPLNQQEGLTVYTESEYSDFGRNNSALSNGMLRAAVNDGEWIPLDRAGVSSPCWPRDASYIYGGKFYEYLAEKYGPKKLALYQRKHSNLVIPWMQNLPAKSTFGQSFPKLWDQWRRYAYKQYSAQIESLKTLGLTNLRMLTGNGSDKYSLAGSPDGRFLAYIERNGHTRTSLMLYEPATGTKKVIDQGNFAGSLDFSRDGGLLAYGKMEYAGLGEKLYGDIYLYDLNTKKKKRLTKGARARDPAFSADGQRIYFVLSRMDRNALAVMDLKSKNIGYITDFDDEQLFSHPKVSPDGALMALNVWQPGGYQDIWLFAINKNEWHPLMLDKAQDISPSWSSDGKDIYFASDRSGVWNICRYSLENASITRMTNIIGGAFDPVAANGNLYFLDLGSKGFELAETEPADSFDLGEFPQSKRVEMEPNYPDSSGIYSSKAYCPAKTMLPFFWFPTGMVDEQGSALGVMLMGSDDLIMKGYTALIVPDFTSQRFYYQLDYSDFSRSLYLNLNLSDVTTAEDVNVSGKDTTYYQRKQSQAILLTLPVTRSKWSFAAGLGYRHNNYVDLNGDIFDYNPYWTGHLSRIQLELSFANAFKYGFSISPEKGRNISVESRLYRKELGGDLNQRWNSVWWREYLPLPFRHHVLMAGFRGAAWGKGGYVDEDTPDMDPRGFSYSWPGSRYKAMMTAEYRFPIAYIERGHSTWPLYIKNISGALFFDGGMASGDLNNISWNNAGKSYGGGLRSEWLFSYGLPVDASADYCYESTKRQSSIAFKVSLGL